MGQGTGSGMMGQVIGEGRFVSVSDNVEGSVGGGV